MNRLMQSAKFWTLVLDVIVSLAVYFGGKYGGAAGEDILYVIAALQPVFVALIAGIAWEDAAQKGASG